MKVQIAGGAKVGAFEPQFIIHAENDAERLLLAACVRQRGVFHLHGYTVEQDRPGVAAFNFGWLTTSEK